jgi:nuclear pore complex protein Nup205
MLPEEIALLTPFCRLVRQIVLYSPVARVTLSDHAQYKPIPTLFSILLFPINLGFKAAILDTAAAFVQPNEAGGSVAARNARDAWYELEKAGLVVAANRPGGIVVELENVETPGKTYPASTALVGLLCSLIHTPSKHPSAPGLGTTTSTIPENLGQGHRLPGVEPYIRFVIEDVLIKAPTRPFSDQASKWRVMDRCLCFLEKCLACLDLNRFLVPGSFTTAAQQQLVAHPGFDVLLRLLNSSKLLELIFSLVSTDSNDIENDVARTPLFPKVIKRSLRLLYRVFQLQAPFLDVIRPELVTSSIALPSDKLTLLRSADGLDLHLLHKPEVVVRVATYVNVYVHNEIAFLSIKIVTALSDSTHWNAEWQFRDFYRAQMNRLAGVLDTSQETLRIIDGYVRRLESDNVDPDPIERDEEDPVVDFDELKGELDGAGMDQAIRGAVLDLLLLNTQSHRPAPNVAHLLLGYDIRSRSREAEVQNPAAEGSRIACLHTILSLLAPGPTGDEFRELHAPLAEKCYRLVLQLCLHDYTSASTSRYLRTQEDYYYSQTCLTPFGIPVTERGYLGEVRMEDGSRIITSCSALTGTLHGEAWLLESVAVELSMLASSRNTQRIGPLVSALLDVSILPVSDFGTLGPDEPDQKLSRILEIFRSLDFEWHDTSEPPETEWDLLRGLPYETCLRPDDHGCEIYDFRIVLSLISAAAREMQDRGGARNVNFYATLKAEVESVLRVLASENNRRQVEHAQLHALKSWRTVLSICLDQGFEYLEPEVRYRQLFELLEAVLPPLTQPQISAEKGEILSGAGLLLIAKLRGEEQSRPQGDEVAGGLYDNMHRLLRQILRAIIQSGSSSHVIRGNLYALLLNHLRYSDQLSPPTLPGKPIGSDFGTPTPSVIDDGVSVGGASSTASVSRRLKKKNPLAAGNVSILQSHLDRLLGMLCRDAEDGPDVWQTVAYATLDAIVSLANDCGAAAQVATLLHKQGDLQSVVSSLKNSEPQLMDVLTPDPRKRFSSKGTR